MLYLPNSIFRQVQQDKRVLPHRIHVVREAPTHGAVAHCSRGDDLDKKYPGNVVLCRRIWNPQFAGTTSQVLVVGSNCVLQRVVLCCNFWVSICWSKNLLPFGFGVCCGGFLFVC